MSETRIPLFVILSEDLGEEPAFILEHGVYVPNPAAGEPAPLAEVAVTGLFDIKPAAEQVGHDVEDPPEARILPGTRYVEVNSPMLLQELIATGEFTSAVAPE